MVWLYRHWLSALHTQTTVLGWREDDRPVEELRARISRVKGSSVLGVHCSVPFSAQGWGGMGWKEMSETPLLGWGREQSYPGIPHPHLA